jgi:hypothetical protein
MSSTYGFALFALPRYRDAEVAGVRIVRHLPSLADGYLSRTTLEQGRHVLYVGKTAWMSTGLMEQESHAFHVHEASGLVVAAGLGMGMYAFAASLKPEVEQVVVVERHPGVIAVMKAAAAFDDWPGRSKVTILETDALAPELASHLQAATGGRRPDYLFADIWPTCASPNAPREAALIVRALRPKAAGWWGQELSFGLWCRDGMRQSDETSLREYFASVTVPVRVTEAYAAFCRDVIAANLPPTAGWRRTLRRILRRAAG